jgi:adenylate cyclase class 2
LSKKRSDCRTFFITTTYAAILFSENNYDKRYNFGAQHNMENLEIEAKFYLKDIESMRRRIFDLGGESKGRVFETNICYEDANNTLIQKKMLLRLRQDEKAKLTFKSSPTVNSRDFKVFSELEVEVDDLAAMGQILEGLGFHPEQKYEKWRETLILGQTGLFLDRMPYGDFLEIEGQPQDIKCCAWRLALDWNRRILMNYLEIFEIIRKKLNLQIKDLIFKDFENVKVEMTAFLDRLEAGHE